MLDQVLKIIEDRRQRSVEELRAFLAIPSISTDAAHAGDVQRCAQYLVQRLTGIGLSARIEPTDGLPVVLAHNEHQPDRPTILFYAHFDVQPPEPLDQWKSPPFEPTVRDGAIYARGAADDKGQLWAHLEAIAAWQKSGGLPVNVILLLESEEEIGSANLAAFMCKHRRELAADLAVISDTGQFARDIPAITYATRGLVYLDVTLTGANHDLHSGLHGGAVPNAANALVKLLSTLHLEDGRVNIPGFYDDVAPLSEAEREAWRKLPHDDVAYAAGLGIKPDQLTGERGYSSIERRWGRPTCDINGLTAGYQGPGAKTVIGSTASAKVSCRIVPNQNPHRIAEALERALRDRCDPSVSIEIHVHSLADAGITPRDGQAVTLASEAIRIGFGTSPALIRSGGTLPIVAMLASELSLETVMVGFSRPDDRLHSPNEKFDLGALYHGTRTAAVLYERLSQLKRS